MPSLTGCSTPLPSIVNDCVAGTEFPDGLAVPWFDGQLRVSEAITSTTERARMLCGSGRKLLLEASCDMHDRPPSHGKSMDPVAFKTVER